MPGMSSAGNTTPDRRQKETACEAISTDFSAYAV